MGESHLGFDILADTAQLSMWILMPKDKAYHSWIVTRTVTEKQGKVEQVIPIEQFLSADSMIIGFQLVSAKQGERYETSWTYK